MQDPTERFTDRVETYARYRPGYPDDMLRFLRTLVGLPATVADIGSGTGILTRQLLDNGYALYAIEPNEAILADGAGQALTQDKWAGADLAGQGPALANLQIVGLEEGHGIGGVGHA